MLLAHAVREALTTGCASTASSAAVRAYKERFATSDPGLETFGLPRGAPAQLLLTAAHAAERALARRTADLDRP